MKLQEERIKQLAHFFCYYKPYTQLILVNDIKNFPYYTNLKGEVVYIDYSTPFWELHIDSGKFGWTE